MARSRPYYGVGGYNPLRLPENYKYEFASVAYRSTDAWKKWADFYAPKGKDDEQERSHQEMEHVMHDHDIWHEVLGLTDEQLAELSSWQRVALALELLDGLDLGSLDGHSLAHAQAALDELKSNLD